VLLGVILAESLKRQNDRRQRSFELRLMGRTLLDEFFESLDRFGRRGNETERTGNAVQAMAAELEALVKRGTPLKRGKSTKRAAAIHAFILKFAAAKVRLQIENGALRAAEIQALKDSMVAYENTFGGGVSDLDRELAGHYVDDGIDIEPSDRGST